MTPLPRLGAEHLDAACAKLYGALSRLSASWAAKARLAMAQAKLRAEPFHAVAQLEGALNDAAGVIDANSEARPQRAALARAHLDIARAELEVWAAGCRLVLS